MTHFSGVREITHSSAGTLHLFFVSNKCEGAPLKSSLIDICYETSWVVLLPSPEYCLGDQIGPEAWRETSGRMLISMVSGLLGFDSVILTETQHLKCV